MAGSAANPSGEAGGRDAGCDVVALVDELLAEAARRRASDLHFEPTASGLLVRLRLDGALTTLEALPAALAEKVVARLKVIGSLLTYRNDIPQEGRIAADPRAPGGVRDRRLAVFPTVHGQRAVVRLFYDEQSLTSLDGLGLPEPICAALKRIAAAPQGVLLLTGPAGSGKSTTLAAILRHILAAFPGRSIVALEDPVEQYIDGVTQVQISPHGPMTFPLALRSLLRQDPEVLMIGEIRDAETARIAIEAGLTGHLLMSTMHSGTPAGALLRLLEMSVEPYQVTSSVSAVLNQRLLRRLCEKCRRPAGGGRCEPAGCEACFHTGFAGRTLVAELVEMAGPLRQAVLAKADLDALEATLRAGGHGGIRRHGELLVERGVTSAGELERVCGPAEGKEA